MIRPFKKEDAERCSKIMLKCIKQFDSYTKENKDFLIKMSQIDKLIEKAQKTMFYVYEKDGEILGTGVFNNGEIRTMFIDPKHQRKGIGKKILGFLIKLAKSKGYNKVWVGVNPDAEKFYKKQGFKKIREENDFNFRTIIMEKEI